MKMLSKSNARGKAIGELLPPVTIKEVFVPYDSLNKSEGDLSDQTIRELFDKCNVISEKEFRGYHLAPWKELVVTSVTGERTQIRLMLGGKLGTVDFEDVGRLLFKCAE